MYGKKLLAILLSICLLTGLTGCSSGVSAEEYDALAAERDTLQAEVESLQAEVASLQAETAAAKEDAGSSRAAELGALVSEVRARFEEQYKYCVLVLNMVETYLSWDMAKEWTNLQDDYESMTMNLGRFEEYLNDEEALEAMNELDYEALLESVQNRYDYWLSASYQDISYVADYCLGTTSDTGSEE